MLFIPTPRTFLKAINNGNFLIWPDLNNQQLLKHLPPRIATALGHQGQEIKNLQYTKNLKSVLEVEKYNNLYLEVETVTTHDLCATIIPFNINRRGSSDLTGAFPHKSNREVFYGMVVYDYDSNAIMAEPIKKQAGSNHPRCVPQYPLGPQSNR